MSDNRIGDGSGGPQLTVGDIKAAAPPGAGGWVPPAWSPIVVGVGGAGLTAVADLVNASCASGTCQPLIWSMLLAAFVKGVVLGAVGFFGMKSAGPRAQS